MDAAHRRPQLPALSYLDIDKAKRDEEAYQNRNTGAPQSLPAVTAASPTFQYPPGPPPPYSQPTPSQHTNSWANAQAGVHTPPESRRTSGDERENVKQTARQSLPSLSEALGVDNQPPYSSSTPTQPSLQSAHTLPPHSAAPSSPPATKRSSGMDPPHAPHVSYSNPIRPYSQSQQDGPLQHSYSSQDSSRPTYTPLQGRSPLQVQTSQSAPSQAASTYSYHSRTSPQHEQQPAQSSAPLGPPSFPYGYTTYPSRYAQATPTSSASTGPIYQPSTNYAAPPTPSSAWKSEPATSGYAPDDRVNGQYGESIKRHLDMYDFEAALNEIAQTCGIVTDFTRRYGDRLHQTARSGPTLATLPSIVEVDDMIAKSRNQMESLAKIRDVVLTQQAAYEQQAAEQRQQHKAYAEQPLAQEHHSESDESKAGFAGSDTKKRRGRAAPPGRCHSCNRAETPEWRRGPDGARTLCNACGLHYAKLTRKQNGANKNAAVGNSNLRPKEAAS